MHCLLICRMQQCKDELWFLNENNSVWRAPFEECALRKEWCWARNYVQKKSSKELFVRWASLAGVLQQKSPAMTWLQISGHTNQGGWIKLTQVPHFAIQAVVFNIFFLIILYTQCQVLASVLLQYFRKKTKCTQISDILLSFKKLKIFVHRILLYGKFYCMKNVLNSLLVNKLCSMSPFVIQHDLFCNVLPFLLFLVCSLKPLQSLCQI